MAKIVKEFPNAEYGITAVVAQIESGYSVTIRDDDANEYAATAIIYKTEEAAILKAQEVAC
jgi:hypothetical protein